MQPNSFRISPQQRPPLDLQRVGRGTLLRARLIGPGQYEVAGDEETHYVELQPYITCDCGDYEWKDSLCKHICSALLEDGDSEALDLMYQWTQLEKQQKAAREAEREAKRKEREARSLAKEQRLQADLEKRKQKG